MKLHIEGLHYNWDRGHLFYLLDIKKRYVVKKKKKVCLNTVSFDLNYFNYPSRIRTFSFKEGFPHEVLCMTCKSNSWTVWFEQMIFIGCIYKQAHAGGGQLTDTRGARNYMQQWDSEMSTSYVTPEREKKRRRLSVTHTQRNSRICWHMKVLTSSLLSLPYAHPHTPPSCSHPRAFRTQTDRELFLFIHLGINK